MKLTSRLATMFVASASLLAVSSAGAASYSAGDLLLGFRATGGTGQTTDYIINLGSSTTIRDASIGTSLGDYGTDLTATYGSGWASRSDLFWGLATIREQDNPFTSNVVNGDPEGTLYASFNTAVSLTSIANGGTGYLGMATEFGSLSSSSNASNASFSSAPQIWTTQMSGPGSFNNNTPDVEHPLSDGSTIDIYRYLSTTTGDTFGGSVGQPNLVHTLGINSTTGNISIVPEPSSALLGTLGVLLLFRRRRAKA